MMSAFFFRFFTCLDWFNANPVRLEVKFTWLSALRASSECSAVVIILFAKVRSEQILEGVVSMAVTD